MRRAAFEVGLVVGFVCAFGNALGGYGLGAAIWLVVMGFCWWQLERIEARKAEEEQEDQGD